jgi:hypothetical protein
LGNCFFFNIYIKLHADIINLLSQAAYVAVMQTTNSSSKSGFESLLRVYRESDLSQEKVRILSMLDLKYMIFLIWSCLMLFCISDGFSIKGFWTHNMVA